MADDTCTLLKQAWELCYLDPQAACEIGRHLAQGGGGTAAAGWLHVALFETRAGDAARARTALAQARACYTETGDALGLAWCDEVHAIGLRRAGDLLGSAQLQSTLDARSDFARDAMYEFVSRLSRGATAKHLGRNDTALRHDYAAVDAAARTGWPGPRITAMTNLGAYHLSLLNLEDARQISEDCLVQAREARAKQAIGVLAANLIIIYYAQGEPAQARAMTEYLVTHDADLVPGTLARLSSPLALGHLAVGEIERAEAYLEAGANAAIADGDGIAFWAWLSARCLLARGHAADARALAQRVLEQRRAHHLSDEPFDHLQLQLALADACEQVGDTAAALACMRQAHAAYEQLVGRSARARFVALEVTHQLAQAQRERDLALDSRRSAEDDSRRLGALNAALQAQMAQTELLHAQLRENALRDALTGLHNRRYLFEMAPGLLGLARRQSSQLCVVLIDLDHFKLLNDTYGHQAGDLVLQRFSALLAQMLRTSDVVARYGGEEFVAVMPDIDADGAQAMLGRLLEAYQTQHHEMGRRRLPRCSFSAGIALFPKHGNTLEQLLARADRALYLAKHHGRARIEQAPRSGFGTLV